MTRRVVYICAAIALLVALAAWFHRMREPHSSHFRVNIVSIVEIEPIAQLRAGFREQFSGSEFAAKHAVEFQDYNGQGDPGLINQIADKVAAEHPDLVFVLGTPAAQAIQKRAPDILLVQGAVTDPVSAGLANDWNGSGKNYVATSDLPPIALQVNLIQTLTPSVKHLGVIYNPGEANSVAVISRLRDYLKGRSSLSLIEKPITNSGDVVTVLAALQGHVDGIYLPPDNTAYTAVPVIGRFCFDNHLPFYATVRSSLDSGALATLSLDFFQLGRQSASLALQVLGGKDPRTMPIEVSQNPTISINAQVARQLHINLSSFRNRPNVMIVEPLAK